MVAGASCRGCRRWAQRGHATDSRRPAGLTVCTLRLSAGPHKINAVGNLNKNISLGPMLSCPNVERRQPTSRTATGQCTRLRCVPHGHLAPASHSIQRSLNIALGDAQPIIPPGAQLLAAAPAVFDMHGAPRRALALRADGPLPFRSRAGPEGKIDGIGPNFGQL